MPRYPKLQSPQVVLTINLTKETKSMLKEITEEHGYQSMSHAVRCLIYDAHEEIEFEESVNNAVDAFFEAGV